jgi:chorismate synthase|tara:strand:+ start:155 stop:358 length:204 start_codon:yes stop_codon:yes gene_type:complete
MVEAMVALTLVDSLMMQQAQCELFPNDAPIELKPNPMGSTVSGRGEPGLTTDASGKENAMSQRIDEE